MPEETSKSQTSVPRYYKIGFIASSVAASILFFALIFSLFYNLSYLLSANPNNSTLTVEASSTREVIANEAKATVTVIRRNQSSDQVNQDLDEATNQLISILQENGISRDDIETNKNVFQDYSSFEPRISPQQGSEKMGYMGNLNVTINFKNIENADTRPNEILQSLNQIPDLQFNGYDYSVENREQICNELESEALKKAMEKGQDQVKVLKGKRIVKTSVISVLGCNSQEMPYYGRAIPGATEDSQSSEPAPVLPSKNELTANVAVEFEYSL